MGNRNMIEYEYTLRVDSLEPFFKFCKTNCYNLTAVSKQNRIVFENKQNRKIIATLTTTEKNGIQECVLDFKNKLVGNDTFKQAQESLPIVVSDDMKPAILSMLEVIDFEKTADNFRTRYVYEKDGVEFEIDDYTRPVMKLVAIEGEKEKVDKVYQQIKSNSEIAEHIELG